jgi:hypothetical protein
MITEPLFDIAVGVASFFAGVPCSPIAIGGVTIIKPLLVVCFGIDMRYALAPHCVR